MKLTFIGNGEMAKSIIKGLFGKFEIEVIGRDKAKLNELNSNFGNSLEVKTYQEAKDITSKHIILCVKPYALEEVALLLTGRADSVISILAGISLEKLKQEISAKYYIRAMPNIAATFCHSSTTFTGDKDFAQEAHEILSSIGMALWLDSEKELNASVALSGCAPAFLALVTEALIDASVSEGLKRKDAQELSRYLFSGYSVLLNNIPPTLIKEKIMSPGGSTAAGYGELEKKGVKGAFWDAVHKAVSKTH